MQHASSKSNSRSKKACLFFPRRIFQGEKTNVDISKDVSWLLKVLLRFRVKIRSKTLNSNCRCCCRNKKVSFECVSSWELFRLSLNGKNRLPISTTIVVRSTSYWWKKLSIFMKKIWFFSIFYTCSIKKKYPVWLWRRIKNPVCQIQTFD